MRYCLFIVIVFSPWLGLSQKRTDRVPTTNAEYFLKRFAGIDSNNNPSFDKIALLRKKLSEKKDSYKNDHDFLKFIFFKTHQKILKNYQEYCSFNALLKEGTYNCLTATALYAILFDDFNISYQIFETNYHIFILAKTSKGNVLIESTDPLNGFIDRETDIEQRINSYRNNVEMEAANTNKIYFQYSFNMFNKVTLQQLNGLLFFNLSIDAYNRKDLKESINYLDKASMFYKSKRVEEFSRIIWLTLEANKVNEADKEVCFEKLKSLQQKFPVIASKKF